MWRQWNLMQSGQQLHSNIPPSVTGRWWTRWEEDLWHHGHWPYTSPYSTLTASRTSKYCWAWVWVFGSYSQIWCVCSSCTINLFIYSSVEYKISRCVLLCTSVALTAGSNFFKSRMTLTSKKRNLKPNILSRISLS